MGHTSSDVRTEAGVSTVVGFRRKTHRGAVGAAGAISLVERAGAVPCQSHKEWTYCR